MKFEVTKAIYAINRKEAVIGNKYYYGFDLHSLRINVENNNTEYSGELISIDEHAWVPFQLSTSNTLWDWIYPMED